MSKQWVERHPYETMSIQEYNFQESIMESNQQRENQEHEEQVEALLLKSVRFLSKDEFSLLCYMCGKSSNDYQTMPTGGKE